MSIVSIIWNFLMLLSLKDRRAEKCVPHSSDVAEAFYRSVNSQPALDILYSTNLPPKGFYQASLKDFRELDVTSYQSLANSVKQTVKETFPKITPDMNKRLATNNIADFLSNLGIVNDDNLDKLVNMHTDLLLKEVKKSDNLPEVARNGFDGLIEFLVSSGALNGDNARDFFDPLLLSYFAAENCEN